MRTGGIFERDVERGVAVKVWWRLGFCVWFGLACVRAWGQAEVNVVKKDGAGKVGLDLSGLRGSGGATPVFLKTLADDLQRSGWFVLTRNGSVIVQGTAADAGRLAVACQVASRGGTQFLSRSYADESARARQLAHRVADDIVEAVMKKKGIASTRIVMVGNVGKRKDLYLCDADGANLRNITQRGLVCVSPMWAPDANTIVFTWYARAYPDVYRISLNDRTASPLASFPGLNAGASVAPDGARLALTLSKDGNPELYTLGMGGGRPARLTHTPHASEACPCWSPDGRRLVYVSNQSGSPQLYIMGVDGGAATRITFRGSENVSPNWGPDGRIVYSSRREGRYQLCVFNPADSSVEQLTSDGYDHENPSWAPDARHVVFTRQANYKCGVYILDTVDKASIPITPQQGEWYAPAWSPK